MTARKLNQTEYAFLKTVSRRLVSACGGVESASAVTRVNKTSLSDYQNPDKPDYFMPADVAADLERDCGVPHMTSAMARLAGGYFFRPQKIPSITAFAEALPKIGKEAGEVLARAGLALSDGRLSPEERESLTGELEELISAAIAAREAIEDEKTKP